MNKNVIIWILVVIIVVAGGYYLWMTNQNASSLSQPYINSQNPAPTVSNTALSPSNNNTVPALTLSSPTVETNSSTSASISGASVTGTVTPNGLTTNYWFEYGSTNSLGSRTASQQIGSGFYLIPTPFYITGLNSNTTYYFRLMASNNLGATYGAIYSFTTNSNPTPKAATPTVHTNNAINISNTTASLNGQVNPNGWQTNYWFEYGKDNTLGSTTSITSVSESIPLMSTVSVTDPLSGLQPLTKYYFRLNAQNQFGTVNSSILSFTTKGTSNIKTTN